MKTVRYAYALTGALLLGGTAASLMLQNPATAQSAQNEPGAITAAAPRAGAPMSFADMVAKLQPAVVNISTKQTIVQQRQPNPFAGTPFAEMFGQGQGGGGPVRREGQSLGSGFIISQDGYVVTNNHVIAPGARNASVDSINVTLANGKEYSARVIGRDESSDLALLKINATGLPFVRFGDSTRTRVGDWVVAIGNPFGLGGTVTAGIVSAVHRVTGMAANDRFIQTDASINRGNSGGPMFDLEGNVVGINSQILGSETGGNIGIGFAIPAETARPIIETLKSGNKVVRGYVGVGLGGPVDGDVASALGIASNRGELIARVEPDGPAAKAGLRVGDVVLRVDGKEVTPEQTLSYTVANLPPGRTAKFEILRNGRPLTVNVSVALRPTEEQLASTLGGNEFDPNDNGAAEGSAPAVPGSSSVLGLTVQPLTPGIARSIGVDANVSGLVIAQVDPSSDAAQKLKRGDVVSAVNGAPTLTAAELSAAVSRARAAGRPQVLLQITRQRQTAFIALRIGK